MRLVFYISTILIGLNFFPGNSHGQVLIVLDDLRAKNKIEYIDQSNIRLLSDNIVRLSEISYEDNLLLKDSLISEVKSVFDAGIGVFLIGNGGSILNVFQLDDFLFRLSFGEFPDVDNIQFDPYKGLLVFLKKVRIPARVTPIAVMAIHESLPQFQLPATIEPVKLKRNTKDSIPNEIPDYIDVAEFKRRSLNKISRLSQYIAVISDKKTTSIEANKAITEAMALFINDMSTVQVSSIKSPNITREFPVRSYLERMSRLNYKKVEIEWADMHFVNEIRKGPDGNYYGSVVFLQRFRGFNDQQIVYEDVTLKRMEVVIRPYGKFQDSQTADLWDVFISNIKVEVTS